MFSPPAVLFSDVFFLCLSGPPVRCFKSPARQRERVLWEPRVPRGSVQPQHGQERRGDLLRPPTRARGQASTAGAGGGARGEPAALLARVPLPALRRPQLALPFVPCAGWDAARVWAVSCAPTSALPASPRGKGLRSPGCRCRAAASLCCGLRSVPVAMLQRGSSAKPPQASGARRAHWAR